MPQCKVSVVASHNFRPNAKLDAISTAPLASQAAGLLNERWVLAGVAGDPTAVILGGLG